MPPISHSERLRQKIALVLPDFIGTSTELMLHPRFPDLYPEFLVRLHWMMRASVPLMQTAHRRCLELSESDRVARALAPYLEQHIKEEMHHDEWMLEDLELLGLPRAEVLRRMPSPTAAACIGSRYYWVLHHHPIAELGAIAVLEGYPPSIEVIDLMQELTGLPRAAFRTLEKHAHLDVNHRDDFNAALDALPLEDEHHEILGVSALYTLEAVAAVYRELLEQEPQVEEMVTA